MKNEGIHVINNNMDKSPKCDVKEKNTKQESSYSGFTTQNSIDKIIQSEQLGGD